MSGRTSKQAIYGTWNDLILPLQHVCVCGTILFLEDTTCRIVKDSKAVRTQSYSKETDWSRELPTRY